MGDGSSGIMDAPRPEGPVGSGIVHRPDIKLDVSKETGTMPGLVTSWKPDEAAPAVIGGSQVVVEAPPPALDSNLPPVEAEEEKAPEDVRVVQESVVDSGSVGGAQGPEVSVDPKPQGGFDASRIGGEAAGQSDVDASRADQAVVQEPVPSKFISGTAQPDNQRVEGGIALNPRSAAAINPDSLIPPAKPPVGKQHKTFGAMLASPFVGFYHRITGRGKPAAVVSEAGLTAGPLAGVESTSASSGIDANPGQLPQAQTTGQSA